MVYFRLQGTNLALQTVAANCFGANTYAFLCFAVLFAVLRERRRGNRILTLSVIESSC